MGGEIPARRPIALICGYHDSTGAGEGLRATLPIAGRTLAERQARLAMSAGAGAVLVLAGERADQLAPAAARLRADGIETRVAASAGEAARAVQASDLLLLVGDGFLAGEEDARRIIEADGFALLTVADHLVDERFERVDGDSRWAGLALVDGQLLKHTAAILQDWDFQSTLLRRAVQEGARQLRAQDEPALIAAARGSDLEELQSRILESTGGFQRDWVSRFLLAPIETFATRRLMERNVAPLPLRLGSLALAAGSAAAFVTSWLWPGLILFLLATPLDGIAERLARLQGQKPQRWIGRVLSLAALLPLGGLAYALAPATGWGTWALAAAIPAFLIALEGEGPQPMPAGLALAEPKGMGWLMLPFAASGLWVAGLGALALYAAGSFFWMQRVGRKRIASDKS